MRRFAKGLFLDVAYTFSRSIDDTPEELENNSGAAQNPYNQNAWGTTVFDFGLMRDFAFTERIGLQARWEVFNLANSPIFGNPNSTLSSGAVGSITSLASDPRAMQFALRLKF